MKRTYEDETKNLGGQISDEDINALKSSIISNHFSLTFIKKLIEQYGYEKLNAALANGLPEHPLLLAAAKEGHTEIVKLLLEYGADTEAKNQYGSTPLLIASYQGHIETVKLLLEYGADIKAKNQEGNTALIAAAFVGHIKTVELLLEYGAGVNDEDDYAPALIAAAQNGHIKTVELLLEYGANTEAKGQYGANALIAAALEGHTEIVELLLKYGANTEAKNKNGATALLFAAYQGHTETVDFLIKKGADTEAVDQEGNTALIVAAYNGEIEVVKLLLANGAKVDFFSETLIKEFVSEDFNLNEHATSFNLDTDVFTKIYPTIKNLFLGANYLMQVMSGDIMSSIDTKSFPWYADTSETLKAIINHRLSSATDFKEVDLICRRIVESKVTIMKSLNVFHCSLTNDENVSEGDKKDLEALFEEIKQEKFERLFGEYSNLPHPPKLSLLALKDISSRPDDCIKFCQKFSEDAEGIIEMAKMAKLLNHDQIIRLSEALDKHKHENTKANTYPEEGPYDNLDSNLAHNDFVSPLGHDAQLQQI